ncbi:MAG: DUF1499 domain-containing protein [Hyphomonadaceae bacterium]|nr:DUF1499 domain-containing protein [Hyphomonadaceae bacterium]
MIDFSTLERPASPNTYLVCTPELCRAARADEPAPVFAVPLETVRLALKDIAPTIAFTPCAQGLCGSFVAQTRLLRFKDDVDVLLAPTASGGTQVAIYSRSRVGYSDLGANRKRVQALLAKLRAKLAA